jgi:TonB family protein
MQAAALALMVVLAMPSIAADERAIKTRTTPVYPEMARRMKITGVVRLTVAVNQDGKVIDVKPISGQGILVATAVEAVHNWKYEPGSSVTTVDVPINFTN